MAVQDPTKASSEEVTNITLDADTLADVQRGYYKKPEFYGDMSTNSNGFDSFKTGVSTAANYFGFASNLVSSLVTARSDSDNEWSLTRAEYAEIVKVAKSIATYGKVPQQTIIDFLVILCSINKIADMKKISDVLEIEELNDSTILRQPFEILAIPSLYKIAYMAQALASLIKLFSRYLNTSQTVASTGADDIASLFSNISSILGGLSGGGAAARLENFSAEDALGHFMSELLEGSRIPMPVIAKNPMKAAPSYVGQTLFGESPTSLSLVDMNEVFNMKIAVFPKPSNGAGVSSFGMQNFSSLSGSMNLSTFVNKIGFGGGSITTGSYKETKINNIVEELKTATGATDTETFQLNSADVAIPLQMALSACNCGTSRTPFATVSFQDGWQLSCHISNHMQKNNPKFLDIVRGLT